MCPASGCQRITPTKAAGKGEVNPPVLGGCGHACRALHFNMGTSKAMRKEAAVSKTGRASHPFAKPKPSLAVAD